LLALAALALGCARPHAPEAASRDVSTKLDAEDREVGRRLDLELMSEVKELDHPALRAYVNGVLAKVAAESGRKLAWTARILDTSHITARSAPGGWVYVTRGLLAALGSESELAAALAHEVGHVAERHFWHQAEFARKQGVPNGDPDALAPEQRVRLFAVLREDENRADDLALGYLAKAGYERDGLRRVLGMFLRLEELGGKDRVPPLLRTHPGTAARIARLSIGPGPSGERKQAEYLRRIDGLLFGEDPRQGYLMGQRYINPSADVQLELPPPWRLRLVGQDLMAALPGQATIVIFARSEHGGLRATVGDLTGDGPEFTRTAVAGREGWLQVGPAGDGISAHKAVIGDDDAAWVLAVVAPTGSEVARQVIDGARRIQDPALARVSPLHVRIETLPEAMSLAELDRIRPSRTNLETLSLLNGVDGTTRLPKGTLVKRVDE
jgi:predicted Zn-dependent protease